MFNFALVVCGNEMAARDLAHRIGSVLLLARATTEPLIGIRASAPAADTCAGIQIARFGATPGGRLDHHVAGQSGGSGSVSAA
jgi:hypothetical protein